MLDGHLVELKKRVGMNQNCEILRYKIFKILFDSYVLICETSR